MNSIPMKAQAASKNAKGNARHHRHYRQWFAFIAVIALLVLLRQTSGRFFLFFIGCCSPPVCCSAR